MSVSRPSPPASVHPSSVRRTPLADCQPMSSPGFQSPVCRFSERPVRLVILGLGVGGKEKETAPPTMVLSPSSRRKASPGRERAYQQRRRSISPLILAVPISLSPPPPLPLSPYNHTCPSTHPPNGRVFSWSLCAPLLRCDRPSGRLLIRDVAEL